jgi:hypothetical protein
MKTLSELVQCVLEQPVNGEEGQFIYSESVIVETGGNGLSELV